METYLLKKVSIFSTLDEQQLAHISRYCVTKHYTREQLILVEDRGQEKHFSLFPKAG